MTKKPSSNSENEKSPKYLNLLTDFGFKKMFGEENNKFLIAFLNSILSESVGTIEDISYLNTEQLGLSPKEKKMVYDIYCTTSDKEHIIVELQIGGQSYYGERAFTYVSSLVSKEAKRGEESTEECPFDDPIFQDFFEQGKVEKLTTMGKEDYAKSILEYQEVQDTIEYEREYARNEGRAEGKAEGIRTTAKNLRSLGRDIATISKATGLSEEEIRKL